MATNRSEASSSAHTSVNRRSEVSPRGGGVCPLLPTGDGLILQDEELAQAGLIHVVGHRPSYRGTVVVAGPNVVDLKVGDLVQYRPFVGTRIDVDGQSWMLVREDECVCRLG